MKTVNNFFLSLFGKGMQITIYIIQGYLKALGLARTAEVKRDARIGEAEARKETTIKEAIAEEERMAAK